MSGAVRGDDAELRIATEAAIYAADQVTLDSDDNEDSEDDHE